MIVSVLQTKPSGLYRQGRGLGLDRVSYRQGDLISESPSLPSTPGRVQSGHGTKSSILYLHSPAVRPKYIVRLSGYPLIQDSHRHTERSTNKKVHAIEEINVLSGKMDELMKLFASKNVSSDPNDMPLSTLIENNNESMDVNFVGRNNFGNNAYRGNFNPRLYPSNPSNNYGNSYNNSYGNYNNMPSDFESNIK